MPLTKKASEAKIQAIYFSKILLFPTVLVFSIINDHILPFFSQSCRCKSIFESPDE